MARIRPIQDRTASPIIDVVRGRLDRRQTEELLDFWRRVGGPTGEAARQQIPEVVCRLRLAGTTVGVSAVRAADVALIGGRRFWICAAVLTAAGRDHLPALIRATFSALEGEFDGAPGAPVGLCVLIGDAAERRRRPEAEWSDPRMIYAGYLADGRQVRIAYFRGAEIGRKDPPA